MSDELKVQAENNKILEIVAGSNLYGTNTPDSDEDFVGVFMPPAEYVLGLKSVKEVDLSLIDKNKDGKNTANAIDRKLYEFRKFISLALQNNPNIIEILFVNKESIKFSNEIGESLLSLNYAFPSQQCVPKFLGYAKAQKHKMIIRKENFLELRDAYIFLNLMDPKLTMGQVYDNQDAYSTIFKKKETGMHIHCGDVCFEPGIYAKKALKMLKQRLDKPTSRSKLVLKHGFDTKFGSHLIRLLYEGLMLLEREEIIFPLPMSELLLDIKQGKWELGQVIEHADELEKKLKAASEKTKLPKNANYNMIEDFVIKTMRNHLKLT